MLSMGGVGENSYPSFYEGGYSPRRKMVAQKMHVANERLRGPIFLFCQGRGPRVGRDFFFFLFCGCCNAFSLGQKW